MQLINLFVVLAYLLLNMVVGMFASKSTKDFTHFSVGNRSFSSIILFCTLSASFIGGGYTIGTSGKVFSSGMIYAYALLGFSLKEILVAFFIAPRMGRYQDCLSVGDIVFKTYGKIPQVVTGIFAVLICTGIIGAQVSALAHIFQALFPGVDSMIPMLVSYAIILIYCTLGGMNAVVYTDVMQFIILAIAIPLVFFVSLHSVGGWQHIVATVPTEKISPFGSAHEIYMLVGLFLAFMFGEILVPPYVQRLFMTSPRATFIGTLLSGIFSIPFFLIVGAIGLVVLSVAPNIDANTALPYAIIHMTPIFIRGLLIAALISIIMSSAAGFLNAGAIAFTNDVLKTISPRKICDKKLMTIAKFVTIGIGLLSVIFALGSDNALDILLLSYDMWSPILLIPLLAAIFGVRATALHFMLAGISGFIASMAWHSVMLTHVGLMNSVIFGILVNLVVFTLTKFIFPVFKKV